jgi:DNA-binding MurR/RpiR family transcriptional regulator
MAQGAVPFMQRILDSYDEMPRGERRLADLVLENPTAPIDGTATDLALQARISKATAARFFRRLGYPNFKAARDAARAEIMARSPKYDRHIAAALNPATSLAQHLQSEVHNLVRTLERQRSDELNRALRIFARAEKLWVVGFDENYALAHFARTLLIRVRPDVRMIPLAGFPVPEEFASISPGDAMLAFGVGRPSRALQDVAGSALSAGTATVFVTDQFSPTPSNQHCLVLRCRVHGASLFDSHATPISLIAYLCSALAVTMGTPAIERLNSIQEIQHTWDNVPR